MASPFAKKKPKRNPKDDNKKLFDRQELINQLCTDFLCVIHETVLDRVQQSVEMTMRSCFVEAIDKIQHLYLHMKRDECLLSKIYCEIMEKISDRNAVHQNDIQRASGNLSGDLQRGRSQSSVRTSKSFKVGSTANIENKSTENLQNKQSFHTCDPTSCKMHDHSANTNANSFAYFADKPQNFSQNTQSFSPYEQNRQNFPQYEQNRQNFPQYDQYRQNFPQYEQAISKLCSSVHRSSRDSSLRDRSFDRSFSSQRGEKTLVFCGSGSCRSQRSAKKILRPCSETKFYYTNEINHSPSRRRGQDEFVPPESYDRFDSNRDSQSMRPQASSNTLRTESAQRDELENLLDEICRLANKRVSKDNKKFRIQTETLEKDRSSKWSSAEDTDHSRNSDGWPSNKSESKKDLFAEETDQTRYNEEWPTTKNDSKRDLFAEKTDKSRNTEEWPTTKKDSKRDLFAEKTDKSRNTEEWPNTKKDSKKDLFAEKTDKSRNTEEWPTNKKDAKKDAKKEAKNEAKKEAKNESKKEAKNEAKKEAKKEDKKEAKKEDKKEAKKEDKKEAKKDAKKEIKNVPSAEKTDRKQKSQQRPGKKQNYKDSSGAESDYSSSNQRLLSGDDSNFRVVMIDRSRPEQNFAPLCSRYKPEQNFADPCSRSKLNEDKPSPSHRGDREDRTRDRSKRRDESDSEKGKTKTFLCF